MWLPPAIIVHSLAHARAALAPGRPVTLLSAPGAALYAGCLWWAELLRAADATGPSLLDCADATVAAIAAAQGAVLLAAAPPALDLALRGADRKLTAWLDDIA
jgi:hypothetical protein